MLEMCKQIDFASLGAELHIYGDGSEKADIAALVQQQPNRSIFIYSSVNREAIPETLMKYDVTLIPLITPIYGAIPSKIYEAMAAGLPIIFSGGGEGEKIINEHGAGWSCKPSDFQAITDKIKQVAAMDEATMNKTKANCIKAARNVFNREIQIEHLNQFLLKANS
jgi:glycosyltransferase involved in cell wall biosynthesis